MVEASGAPVFAIAWIALSLLAALAPLFGLCE
jgi:hypothetical protein